MSRRLQRLATIPALAVAAALGCAEEPLACQRDADCPAGSICREARCGPLDSDGGAGPEAGSGACLAEGAACAASDDCCGRACTAGRCAAAGPPPPPRCAGPSELCLDDCCAGLACSGGVCR